MSRRKIAWEGEAWRIEDSIIEFCCTVLSTPYILVLYLVHKERGFACEGWLCVDLVVSRCV